MPRVMIALGVLTAAHLVTWWLTRTGRIRGEAALWVAALMTCATGAAAGAVLGYGRGYRDGADAVLRELRRQTRERDATPADYRPAVEGARAGDTVRLAPGRYVVDRPLVVSEGVVVDGGGRAEVVFAPRRSLPLFVVGGPGPSVPGGFVLRGVTLDDGVAVPAFGLYTIGPGVRAARLVPSGVERLAARLARRKP